MPKNLLNFINKNNQTKVDDLSTDAQTLFELIVLIVDIKYRLKYGKTFDTQRGKGYSDDVQFNKVLADQISPVDDGLLGH